MLQKSGKGVAEKQGMVTVENVLAGCDLRTLERAGGRREPGKGRDHAEEPEVLR